MARPTLGDFLRQHRLAAGLTQSQLAELAGVSVRSIGNIESNSPHLPRPDTLRLIAQALQLADAEVRTWLAALPDPAAPSVAQSGRGDGTPPTLLPNAIPLVGRDSEISQLRAWLFERGERLITLSGTGGVGKTSLAVHIGSVLGPHFADGCSFVPLLSLSVAGDILPLLAGILGITESPGRSLREQIIRWLAQCDVLLIFDNAEHLHEAAPIFADLIANTEKCRIIVTSRVALNVRSERVMRLSPLAVPPIGSDVPIEELARVAAVECFVAAAQRGSPEFLLHDLNVTAVCTLCRALDGLPLTLELAAARLNVFSPQELVARLDQRLTMLTDGPQDVPTHQRSLYATIAWSLRLLPTETQRLFRMLGVLPGEWDLAVAEALGQVAEISPASIVTLLGMLINASLVQRVSDPAGTSRFAMLESIRAFAWEELCCQEDELIATQQALCEHFLSLAEEAGAQMKGPERATWLARIKQERGNLHIALQWAIEHEPAKAWQMVGHLWRVWYFQGTMTEGLVWIERLLATKKQQITPELRAKVLVGGGTLATSRGAFDRARTYLTEGLAIWRTLADQQGMVSAINMLAVGYLYQGDLAHALALYQEGLAIYERLGDRLGMGTMHHNLGIHAYYTGQIALAEAHYAAAMKLRQEVHDTRGEMSTLIAWIDVAREAGDIPRAQRLLEEAQRQSTGSNDVAYPTLLNNWGEVEREKGHLDHALQLLQESLALFREIDELSWSVAGVQMAIGTVLRDMGQFDGAEQSLRESLHLRQLFGDTLGMAETTMVLAQVALQKGTLSDAQHLYRESLALQMQSGARQITAQCLAGLAWIFAQSGQLADAAALCGLVQTLCRSQGRVLPRSEQRRFEDMQLRLIADLGATRFHEVAQRTASLSVERSLQELIRE
jgi:predicted ATPase/DNA-binding XRE family transcriptional regulator